MTPRTAHVGRHVAQIYEQAFAPDDNVYLYAVKEAANGWAVGKDDEGVLVEPGKPVDLARFSERFVSADVNLTDDRRLIEQIVGTDALAGAEWAHGVNFLPRDES